MIPLHRLALTVFPNATALYTNEGTDMSDQPNNSNNNRLGLWALEKPGVRGNGEFGGKKYQALIVATGATGNAPTHELWMRPAERDGQPVYIPLWKNDKGISGQHGDYWVNLFQNTDKKNPSGPDVSVVFKPKAAAVPAETGSNAAALIGAGGVTHL